MNLPDLVNEENPRRAGFLGLTLQNVANCNVSKVGRDGIRVSLNGTDNKSSLIVHLDTNTIEYASGDMICMAIRLANVYEEAEKCEEPIFSIFSKRPIKVFDPNGFEKDINYLTKLMPTLMDSDEYYTGLVSLSERERKAGKIPRLIIKARANPLTDEDINRLYPVELHIAK